MGIKMPQLEGEVKLALGFGPFLTFMRSVRQKSLYVCPKMLQVPVAMHNQIFKILQQNKHINSVQKLKFLLILR